MSFLKQLFADAQAHHHAGRFAKARQTYHAVLQVDPEHADAWHLLGTAAAQAGDSAGALGALKRAVALAPDRAPYRNNLGVILQDLGRLEDARAEFEAACQRDPAYTEAPYNLAKLLKQVGEPDAAVEAYEMVLAREPERADALINLGNLMFDALRLDEAVDLYGRAAEQGGRDEDRARAWINQGNAYRRMGGDGAATAAYDKALAVAPHDGLAIKRALTLPVIPRSDGHIAEIRARFAERIAALSQSELHVDDPALETSTTTFFLAYHARSDRELQERVAELHLRACPSLADPAAHCEAPSRPSGRIRLGMVSAYFRRHSIGRMTQEIVARLDRDAFEVTVFTYPGDGDEVSRRIEAAADHVQVLPDGFWEARETIANAGMDILFFTDLGMDVRTYFLAFGRLAPVQCVTWGHPDTTGIPNVDTFLSSALMEPDGAQAQYSEHLHLLDTLPTCYRRPAAPAPKTRDDFGFSTGAHIYLCPQMAIKFHPDLDRAVERILAADGRGEVVLLEGAVPHWTQAVLARMAETIPDVVRRVRLIPRVAPDDFLGLLGAADVILDTPHFSGGNTSYEAFAMGKPVVTHAGQFMRGRVTLALYHMIGIDGMIADDLDGFADLAVRLGTDGDFRATMEDAVRRESECLWEEAEAVRELESFFLGAAEGIG